MPRNLQEIIDHADEYAARFEQYEPRAEDERDPAGFAALREAVAARSDAERAVRDAVLQARGLNYSWSAIGMLLGTSGEAARQRYGQRTNA
jgi:DNA-binding transcriptional MocR family regulator